MSVTVSPDRPPMILIRSVLCGLGRAIRKPRFPICKFFREIFPKAGMFLELASGAA